ncbi:MAG: hypothetical protein ACKVOQ_23110 [Cyclobacteriaceae bacterium]
MKVFPLLLIVLVVGCKPKSFSSEKELVAYIQNEENGLKKTNEVGDYKVTVTYRPTDLLIKQEVGENSTQEAITKARKKYQNYYYFILSLSRSGKEALDQSQGFGQYSEMVQKLSFRVPEFVNMTTSASDTISVADFILNRTYGLGSSTDILVVFNKEKAKEQTWVQFNLNEFGMNLGNNRTRFKVNDLDNCPHLSTLSQQ